MATTDTKPAAVPRSAGDVELERLSREATQGEWRTGDVEDSYRSISAAGDRSWPGSDRNTPWGGLAKFVVEMESGEPCCGEANAAFVVALVNACRAGNLVWRPEALASQAAKPSPAESAPAAPRIAAMGEVREALEFYANPVNWIDTPSWDGDPECITSKAIPVVRSGEDGSPCDCGDIARAALAALAALANFDPTPAQGEGRAAIRLMLPFLDMAAGEGLEWVEQENGSPRMDALGICNAVADILKCECGDAAWVAMLEQGHQEIRALSRLADNSHKHPYPSPAPDPLPSTERPDRPGDGKEG